MTSEPLERLINRRSNYKGRLTRIYNFIDDPENHEKIYELQARQAELADLCQKYNSTQEDIELIDDKSHKSHEQERQNTEDKYFLYLGRISELLKEHELNHSTHSCQQHQQGQNLLKIPNLQIPNFDGSITEWANFKALFDGVTSSLVSCCCETTTYKAAEVSVLEISSTRGSG